MPLTDVAIRSFKPAERSFKRADERGLYIEVMPNGSKLWRWKYRFQGLERRLSMGHYPEVPLAEARRRRDEARSHIAAGRDPAAERKLQKLAAAQSAVMTFACIAREYIEQKMVREGRALVTVEKAQWLLDQLKPLHDLPIGDIASAHILAALNRIAAKGKYETARRCRSFTSRVFRYAVATIRADADPAAPLLGALPAPQTKHHAALIAPAKVADLLRAIDSCEAHAITRFAMQLLPHLMTRPGELRQAKWAEFDLRAARWDIPAERMKMRHDHVVPLSKQVIELLAMLYELTGPDGYVLPAFHTGLRPMSENTMNNSLRRMGYSKDEMTSHGWRTTATTLLNESGMWNADAIERSLAHRDRNAIRGTYNRGDYWHERVQLHQWWSDYLDALRDGTVLRPFDFLNDALGVARPPSLNVVDLNQKRAARSAG